MIALLGIALIIASALGGMALQESGPGVIMIPTEYMIVAGLLFALIVIGNVLVVVRGMMTRRLGWSRRLDARRRLYVETFKMLYEILRLNSAQGAVRVEDHVLAPEASPILSAYKNVLKDRTATAFICDCLQMYATQALNPQQMDVLMERDIQMIHRENLEPTHALQRAADALPALGVVSAALGIILMMRSVGADAPTFADKLPGPLVSTFLCAFLVYGLIAVSNMARARIAATKEEYLQSIRHALIAGLSGASPQIAVEIGRLSLAPAVRPSLAELAAGIEEIRRRIEARDGSSQTSSKSG